MYAHVPIDWHARAEQCAHRPALKHLLRRLYRSWRLAAEKLTPIGRSFVRTRCRRMASSSLLCMFYTRSEKTIIVIADDDTHSIKTFMSSPQQQASLWSAMLLSDKSFYVTASPLRNPPISP